MGGKSAFKRFGGEADSARRTPQLCALLCCVRDPTGSMQSLAWLCLLMATTLC